MSTTSERARNGDSGNPATYLVLCIVGAVMAAVIAGLVGALLQASTREIAQWAGATFLGAFALEVTAYRFLREITTRNSMDPAGDQART